MIYNQSVYTLNIESQLLPSLRTGLKSIFVFQIVFRMDYISSNLNNYYSLFYVLRNVLYLVKLFHQYQYLYPNKSFWLFINNTTKLLLIINFSPWVNQSVTNWIRYNRSINKIKHINCISWSRINPPTIDTTSMYIVSSIRCH